MPHRVTDFLRHSSGNLVHIKNKASPGSRRSSLSPNSSDCEDCEHGHHGVSSIKMPDLADAVLKANRRLSLPFIRRDSHHNSSVSLDWKIESPPLLFHGSAEDSTGAMLSGQMVLQIKDEGQVDLDSFTANLKIHITHKRPFQNHCPECQNQYTELKNWQLVASPTTLTKGTHLFPFSTLLDGHLPASANSPVISIEYEFCAEVKLAATAANPHPSPIKFEKVLPVKRALPEPDFPHHSVRLFPPTNIKASAHYSTVIHPTGDNKVTLKLDGLMNLNQRTKTLDLWKLKRVSWKLEERIKTIAPACEKHRPLAAANAAATALATGEDGDDENAKKGMTRAEARILGEKHHHDGWKSDFSGSDGTVDMEFDYRIHPRLHRPPPKQPKYACDGRSRDGTEITHNLLIELVVSKEYAPEGKPNMSAPTGTGRILRMHFGVVLTEHPGLGVSWDNESPPMYQDVPKSPPGYYPALEELIDYEELEWLDAAGASSPERRLSDCSTTCSSVDSD